MSQKQHHSLVSSGQLLFFFLVTLAFPLRAVFANPLPSAQNNTTGQVQGSLDKKFQGVKDLLQGYLSSGEELGASIAVNLNGKDVIDIWGGYADEAKTKTWGKDTIVNVWSSTKTITALAINILIDRGRLDPNQNVAKYWPEFAANGKGDIKVRHLLSHSSGVAGWQEPVTVWDILDLNRSTSLLAQQAPWWTPGTASGYHSANFGHLLGELVRRTTGKSLKEFVAKEIAGPLQADFQIGALESDWPRVADIVPFPPPTSPTPLDPDSIAYKVFTNPLVETPAIANDPRWRRGEVGAANGHTNARGLVRILSSLALGGDVNGKHVLSKQAIKAIGVQQVSGTDLVLGLPVRFGLGFALAGSNGTFADAWLPAGHYYLWGGWGGSLAIVDLDRRLTFSYTMNKMADSLLGNPAGLSYLKQVYKSLGIDY